MGPVTLKLPQSPRNADSSVVGVGKPPYGRDAWWFKEMVRKPEF